VSLSILSGIMSILHRKVVAFIGGMIYSNSNTGSKQKRRELQKRDLHYMKTQSHQSSSGSLPELSQIIFIAGHKCGSVRSSIERAQTEKQVGTILTKAKLTTSKIIPDWQVICVPTVSQIGQRFIQNHWQCAEV